MFGDIQLFFEGELRGVGVTELVPYIFDNVVRLPDCFLQMCIRSLEYPRSDEPKNLKYIGIIPAVGGHANNRLPPWWDIILEHKQPLVVIRQGFVSMDAEELTLPAIEALKDLDVQVIATLVKADEIEGFEVPDNVKIEKFIPFDELFKYTDVLINNGGYGAIQQALYRGVPMVLAEMSEDKTENNARAAWTEAAINLACQCPEPAMVRSAVQKILDDSQYKTRARQLSGEYQKCEPISEIVATIDKLAASGNTREMN